ncbi:hypothetical protein C8R43DRAFT_956744 [Mycena crocata]|nr:hypothetical protein C8R43DRAFT_956744 [Mycena crocata]
MEKPRKIWFLSRSMPLESQEGSRRANTATLKKEKIAYLSKGRTAKMRVRERKVSEQYEAQSSAQIAATAGTACGDVHGPTRRRGSEGAGCSTGALDITRTEKESGRNGHTRELQTRLEKAVAKAEARRGSSKTQGAPGGMVPRGVKSGYGSERAGVVAACVASGQVHSSRSPTEIEAVRVTMSGGRGRNDWVESIWHPLGAESCKREWRGQQGAAAELACGVAKEELATL